MGSRKTILAVCLTAMALSPSLAYAEGTFSAWVFGDYYYVVDSHDPASVDQNGIWFRIVNLTWDEKIDESLSARLKIETASPGSFVDGPASMETYMKDAWIKWSRGGQAVVLGLSTTASHTYTEDIWGYRHIEKIPFEIAGFGGSRDIGVGVTGSFLNGNRLGYHVMAANGSGLLNEQNTGKKVAGSLRCRIAGGLSAEVYSDFEDRAGDTDRATVRGFLGYRGAGARAGLEYVVQRRDRPGAGAYDIGVASGFVTAKVSRSVWLFGRADRQLDPDPNYSPSQAPGRPYLPHDSSVKNTFLLAGAELFARDNVTFSPNVEAIVYDEPDGGDPAPADDIIGRLTFMFRY